MTIAFFSILAAATLSLAEARAESTSAPCLTITTSSSAAATAALPTLGGAFDAREPARVHAMDADARELLHLLLDDTGKNAVIPGDQPAVTGRASAANRVALARDLAASFGEIAKVSASGSRPVSLDFTRASRQDVARLLGGVSDHDVVIAPGAPVAIVAKDVTVESVLRGLGASLGLGVVRRDRTWFLLPPSSAPAAVPATKAARARAPNVRIAGLSAAQAAGLLADAGLTLPHSFACGEGSPVWLDLERTSPEDIALALRLLSGATPRPVGADLACRPAAYAPAYEGELDGATVAGYARDGDRERSIVRTASGRLMLARSDSGFPDWETPGGEGFADHARDVVEEPARFRLAATVIERRRAVALLEDRVGQWMTVETDPAADARYATYIVEEGALRISKWSGDTRNVTTLPLRGTWCAEEREPDLATVAVRVDRVRRARLQRVAFDQCLEEYEYAQQEAGRDLNRCADRKDADRDECQKEYDWTAVSAERSFHECLARNGVPDLRGPKPGIKGSSGGPYPSAPVEGRLTWAVEPFAEKSTWLGPHTALAAEYEGTSWGDTLAFEITERLDARNIRAQVLERRISPEELRKMLQKSDLEYLVDGTIEALQVRTAPGGKKEAELAVTIRLRRKAGESMRPVQKRTVKVKAPVQGVLTGAELRALVAKTADEIAAKLAEDIPKDVLAVRG